MTLRTHLSASVDLDDPLDRFVLYETTINGLFIANDETFRFTVGKIRHNETVRFTVGKNPARRNGRNRIHGPKESDTTKRSDSLSESIRQHKHTQK